MELDCMIYFVALIEPHPNSLCIFVERCKSSQKKASIEVAGQTITDVSPIVADENLPIIQLDFDSYVSYTVINEAFMPWDINEICEGKTFRIYTKSRYLDFVKLRTSAEWMLPNQPFTHYEIPCLNHIIDVISHSEPTVTEIDRETFFNN
jgi:hypothetical protein